MFRSFVILLLCNVAFGQKEIVPSSFDLVYGQKFLDKTPLEGQLNSIKNPLAFQSLMYAGIGMTGYFTTQGKYEFCGHMHYTQVIPQTIQINDSVSGKMTGFNFTAPVYGDDIFGGKKAMNLFVSLGFNAGRLRVYGNSLVKQKNAYISPKVSLTPRFKLGKVMLQMNFDYELDVSKKSWRKIAVASSPQYFLPNTSLTGLSAYLMLGITLD